MGPSSKELRALAAADRAAAEVQTLPNAKQVLLRSAERWEAMAERAEFAESHPRTKY
jgi:hypothetical protein